MWAGLWAAKPAVCVVVLLGGLLRQDNSSTAPTVRDVSVVETRYYVTLTNGAAVLMGGLLICNTAAHSACNWVHYMANQNL
jgi:hypothetical protein